MTKRFALHHDKSTYHIYPKQLNNLSPYHTNSLIWKKKQQKNSFYNLRLQSTLVISNTKGSLKYFKRSVSTYQISRIEKNKSNNRISQIEMQFDSWSKRYIENIAENGRNLMLLRSNFSSFPQYFCCLFSDFYFKTGTWFSLRDKRLFDISEVEITSQLYV